MADKLDTLRALNRVQQGVADDWTSGHCRLHRPPLVLPAPGPRLRVNHFVVQDADDSNLRTAGLLDELTAALDRFRGGNVWTLDGLRPGNLEDVLK